MISEDAYKDSAVSVAAEKREYMDYDRHMVCPDYFTVTDDGVRYGNGTEAGRISVLLTGYADVEIAEAGEK